MHELERQSSVMLLQRGHGGPKRGHAGHKRGAALRQALLQQPPRPSCASLVGPMGLDRVTALMEPRVTSLLATFVWIAGGNGDTSQGESKKTEGGRVF